MAMSALLLCLPAGGCERRDPVVIDGSSPEAFRRSVAEARRDLPDRDRLAYDRALRTVGGRRHAVRDPDAFARMTFNGMTAADVVADQRVRER
jgi:hypothetical protein